MQRFGATRHTARQALFTLEQIGVVERKPNRGILVRDFSIEEVENIYEVREVLQKRAAERFPLPAPKSLTAKLRSIQSRFVQAAQANATRDVYYLNKEFHDKLFGACGNPVLAQAIERYAWFIHAIRSRVFADPEQLNRSQREHDAMIVALEQGDRESLVRICVEHLAPPKEAYIEANKWRLTRED